MFGRIHQGGSLVLDFCFFGGFDYFFKLLASYHSVQVIYLIIIQYWKVVCFLGFIRFF